MLNEVSHSSSAEWLHVPGSVDAHPVGAFEELDPVGAHHPRVSYPVEVRVRGLHLHTMRRRTRTYTITVSWAIQNSAARPRPLASEEGEGEDLGREGVVLLRRLDQPERRRVVPLLRGLRHRGRRWRRRMQARAARAEGPRESPADGPAGRAAQGCRRERGGVEECAGGGGGGGGRHGRTTGREGSAA